MRGMILWLLMLVGLLTAHGVWAAPVAGSACAVPEEFVAPDEPLGRVAAAIAAGSPVDILAIGSATTVGDAKVISFPHRMLDRLRAERPAVRFELTVQGGRGMTAETMLPMIRQAFAEHPRTLVVWQTGTVEAVRNVPPDQMQSVLQEGIDLIRDAGADAILVDAQFSRFLRANVNLDPYESVLQQVTTMPGAVLFRRFDLMRAWADSGKLDLEHTRPSDRDKAIGLLNDCLGEALARFVLNGVDAQAR